PPVSPVGLGGAADIWAETTHRLSRTQRVILALLDGSRLRVVRPGAGPPGTAEILAELREAGVITGIVTIADRRGSQFRPPGLPRTRADRRAERPGRCGCPTRRVDFRGRERAG